MMVPALLPFVPTGADVAHARARVTASAQGDTNADAMERQLAWAILRADRAWRRIPPIFPAPASSPTGDAA